MYHSTEEVGLAKFDSIARQNEKTELPFLGKNISFIIIGEIGQKQDVVNATKSRITIERKRLLKEAG